MARYIGPVCRLCRREDMKLFLKGDRCYTDKCGYERRAYPPGQHGQARRRKNIPSYLVKANDLVEVGESSKKIARIVDSVGAVERRGVPQWLELEKDAFRGRVKTLPARDNVTLPIREQLIVELYSK